MWRWVCVFVCGFACVAAADNPCTNGSFEEVGPDGFPVDWSRVGESVEVAEDAHTGERALRILREEGAEAPETGLNRRWTPASGSGDGLVDRVKGGMEFAYKAVSAKSARLWVLVIPMNGESLEDTTTERAIYEVPADHVGDGAWHVARIKYDYTDVPSTHWVHFGARIVGAAGELLLDDFRHTDEVGPLFTFERTRLEADGPNAFRYFARIANRGDQPAEAAVVRATAPEGMRVDAEETTLPSMAVDEHTDLVWRAASEAGIAAGAFELTVAGGELVATHRASVAPDLRLLNFGPIAPVVAASDPVTYEVVFENIGDATAPPRRVELRGPDGQIHGQMTPPVAPGARHAIAFTSGPAGSPGKQAAELTVASAMPGDAPVVATTYVTALPALDAPDAVVLENDHVRLTVHRGADGYAAAEICTHTDAGWRRGAWFPTLSRAAADTTSGHIWHWDIAPAAAETTSEALGSTLSLTAEATDPDGVAWRANLRFSLGANAREIACDYALTAEAPRALRAFDGPMVYVLDREEAVFPGLEWLVDDEVSSSTRDIEEGHPHQVRYAPHVNMITIPAISVKSSAGVFGLLWDMRQEWAPGERKPAAAFASPDRFNHQRTHLMGLFAPSVPDHVQPNHRLAEDPYDMSGPVRLQCRIYADGASDDVLSTLDAYLAQTELPAPTPLPTGSYDAEIVFGSIAYLESLWSEEDAKWFASKNGPPQMSGPTDSPDYAADLVLAAQLTDDEALRQRCLDRVALVRPEDAARPLHALRRYGPFEQVLLNAGHVSSLLAARGDDGAWRFDADFEDDGVFKGLDYHTLGPDEAAALGTCAEKAYQALRFARITADMSIYERMLPTLELMTQFRVPRAAQVWEVPFFTPDILAAADAVDAYIEAYRVSGEARWLDEARRWARAGLPFVFLWEDDEHPFLLGGSIPVFGATFHQHSWFGNIVQWNGLRYAAAVLKLAEYDGSWPWVKFAALIVHSAVQQQAREGEDAGLWPDSISTLTAQKSGWVFAPRQITSVMLALTGRDEVERTVYVPAEGGRIAISAAAALDQARYDDGALTVRVGFPEGFEGMTLIANVSRPSAAFVNGVAVETRPKPETGDAPGMHYAADLAALAVRVGPEMARDAVIRLEGVHCVAPERLPSLREEIAFTFDPGAEGWTAQHDIEDLTAADGLLHGRITGGDPYCGRAMLRVAGDAVDTVVIRMRSDVGGTGQLYWGTTDAPNVDENKVLTFAVIGDGAFHDYRIPVGEHPRWRGKTITQLRLDPVNGAAQGSFAVDGVRAE